MASMLTSAMSFTITATRRPSSLFRCPCELVRIINYLITWTLKVCRIMAFCRLWAIILPTFGGLGNQ